nr:NADH dehydrogenase subunit 6 [Haania vitalisi]
MLQLPLKMSAFLSIIFLFFNHPLTMGMILFLQTILLSLISGSMSPSFWFSYILIMIYVGGMLVLFMYITSLASNEKFFSSLQNTMLFLSIIAILMIITLKMFPFHNSYENMENLNNLMSTSKNFLIKLYNQPTNIITILIATYLFLTLIAVIKITNIHKGPLRKIK